MQQDRPDSISWSTDSGPNMHETLADYGHEDQLLSHSHLYRPGIARIAARCQI